MTAGNDEIVSGARGKRDWLSRRSRTSSPRRPLIAVQSRPSCTTEMRFLERRRRLVIRFRICFPTRDVRPTCIRPHGVVGAVAFLDRLQRCFMDFFILFLTACYTVKIRFWRTII